MALGRVERAPISCATDGGLYSIRLIDGSLLGLRRPEMNSVWHQKPAGLAPKNVRKVWTW